MTKCYFLRNRTVSVYYDSSDVQLCGPSISGAHSCCISGDTCLEDSICHYTHPQDGGSGYYVAGCIDPSFPGSCSKPCTDQQGTDIVFTDDYISLWSCCYQYLGVNRDCSNPSNQTFYAPSPESLARQAESSSTTSSSAIPSINSSITPSPTPSPFLPTSTSTPTSPNSSSTLPTSIPPSSTATAYSPPSALSAGAKAGISIAASIAGLSIIFLLGIYLLRKRRREQHQETPAISASDKMALSFPLTPEPTTHIAMEISSDRQWELDGNNRSEMEGRGRSELEASR